ncbi:MAG: STAS domain-containing protein [Actinomycetota bacterium]
MAVMLVFDGAIERATIVAYCDRVRALLECADTGPVVCDVGALEHPDAVTIEALARVQLMALGLGRRIELRDVRDELKQLLSFAGLLEVIPVAGASVLEPVGQPEEREEVRGIEEEADAGDPIA